ncbi:hypothetical protein OJF2_10870 [Aquisphaera giovannonii]|uniref:Uncharacterized protein n=1 Tax=Aquisphaera giovannonii TaxID=406548 RepID=A0A5B9VWI5_9BACT|nr:hypothetical protein OJF2_10870 [Aquisphaera giovannonii]
MLLSLALYGMLLAAQAQPEGQSAAIEPAHRRNPVYEEALRTGLEIDGRANPLPSPILRDGMDAAAERAALLRVAGSERALADLLRDSVTAPYILKVRDKKAKDATIRLVDLWFVVRADLDALDPAEVAGQSSAKPVEAGNMRFESRLLADDELKAKGKAAAHGRDLSRWYVAITSVLLDRIELHAIDEAVATRSAQSMVIGARTDSGFGADANRWRNVGRDADDGAFRAFQGGLSYTKVSRLKDPAGALLVEFHAAFSEPEAWFRGAPILRSKFSLIAQDQIRSLRRELLRNRPKGAATSSGAR